MIDFSLKEIARDILDINIGMLEALIKKFYQCCPEARHYEEETERELLYEIRRGVYISNFLCLEILRTSEKAVSTTANMIYAAVETATDIILKGICPYCGGDIVLVIENNELRLRCRQQGSDKCRNWEWVIGYVKRVKRP